MGGKKMTKMEIRKRAALANLHFFLFPAGKAADGIFAFS